MSAQTDKTVAVPVFFEVEPIGEDGALEANGQIYYFCSPTCRNLFVDAAFWKDTDYKAGTDVDYLPGTECETCGKPVGLFV